LYEGCAGDDEDDDSVPIEPEEKEERK